MASFQVDFQRLSLDLPACTIRAIELTIIERASQLLARFLSSAASTRSEAVRRPSPVREATASCRPGGWEASRRHGRPWGCKGVEFKADQ
jgi:hypothetical protein